MTVARCLPARCLLIAIAPLLLAACGSSAPSLSTGSLFGSKADAATPIAAPPPPPPATPEQRAAQVGATSARAVKCGYNFDPAKLKTSFLTAEAQSGTAVDQLGRVAHSTMRWATSAMLRSSMTSRVTW